MRAYLLDGRAWRLVRVTYGARTLDAIRALRVATGAGLREAVAVLARDLRKGGAR